MKAFAMIVRVVALLAVVGCVIGVGSPSARAQVVVTVSPNPLTFGVPTGSVASSAETITFSITGSNDGPGPATVTLGAVGAPANTDFAITTDSCSGVTLTSPGACTVNVTFTPTMLPLGTLETGSISFPNSFTDGTPSVGLTGASGAIKLFDPINVELSNPTSSLTNLFAFKSETINVSCPGSPTAVFSSSPDGVGNVLVDNFLTLNTTGAPPPTPPINSNGLQGNVCPGNLGNPTDNTARLLHARVPESSWSRPTERSRPGYVHQHGERDIESHWRSQCWRRSANRCKQPVYGEYDLGAGHYAGRRRLCRELLIVPENKLHFIRRPDRRDDHGESARSQRALITHSGLPFQYHAGEPHHLHSEFLERYHVSRWSDDSEYRRHGDSAVGFPSDGNGHLRCASAVHTAEWRTRGGQGDATLCKAFTITCTDPLTGISSGANCPQGSALAAANRLFFETKLDSPDDAAIAAGIAAGTGPGLLEGTDNWATTPTLAPCGTGTPALFPAGDGQESGQLCPQNPLTEYKGAADPTSGSNPRGVNSTFIPVWNVPLPLTTVTTTPPPFNATGWVSAPSHNVTINFSSSPATYAAVNGFTPAPIASFTYGTETPLPDPTTGTNGDPTFANGTCPSSTTSNPFNNSATINFGGDGIFNNVHYFATDCAGTEELLFTPSVLPNKNWASFKTVTVKIDSVPPTISAITFSPASTGNIYAAGAVVHANFTCADVLSGLAAPCTGTGGVLGGGVINTTLAPGTYPFKVTATDNAGNQTTSTVNYQVVGSSDLVLLNLDPLNREAGN